MKIIEELISKHQQKIIALTQCRVMFIDLCHKCGYDAGRATVNNRDGDKPLIRQIVMTYAIGLEFTLKASGEIFGGCSSTAYYARKTVSNILSSPQKSRKKEILLYAIEKYNLNFSRL